jgi:hypothetical protein
MSSGVIGGPAVSVVVAAPAPPPAEDSDVSEAVDTALDEVFEELELFEEELEDAREGMEALLETFGWDMELEREWDDEGGGTAWSGTGWPSIRVLLAWIANLNGELKASKSEIRW